MLDANLPGDALIAGVTIEAGTLIASFSGTVISAAAARAIPHGVNGYLIDMPDGNVLDCMQNATARPPRDLASLANQAQGLHDAELDRDLTYHDNNAYTIWRDADGIQTISLYAVRQIRGGEEVMWAYGPNFDLGFDTPTVWSPSPGEPSFSSSEDEARSRELSRDPRAAEQPLGARRRLESVVERLEELYGDRDQEDAFPELGINSTDVSYETITSTEQSASQPASPIIGATVSVTRPEPAFGPTRSPFSAPPGERASSQVRGPFSAQPEEQTQRPVFIQPTKATRRIAPVTLTQAPGGENKKEGGSR